jgi:hypothetical protein
VGEKWVVGVGGEVREVREFSEVREFREGVHNP